MQGPDGAWAVAMDTEWDSEADAKEFEKAASTALKTAGGVGQVLPGAGGTTRWVLIANDAATAAQGRRRVGPGRLRLAPSQRRRAYIDSGAEIPSSVSAFDSVIRAASARARRAAERSGSSGSTTRASR